MKKQLKTLAMACAAAATLSVPALSQAYPDGFSSINFRPAISNKTDYFGVYSSQTIRKQGWNAGFYIDYARNPLEFGQGGNRVDGVVDHQIVGNHYGTYGILDWLSFGVNIPVVWWEQNRTLLTTGANATFTNTFSNNIALGDIRFEMKFRLRNNEDRLVGVALIPFMNIPSGDPFEWAGTGNLTGGAKVVVDFNIGDRVDLALNLGYRLQDRVQILNVDFDDQILGSLGLSVKIIEKLTFIAEAATEPIIHGLFSDAVQTPVEARGGFRVHLNDNFDLNVGGGAGITIGIGSPDYRAFLGLNYNWVPVCDCPEPVVEERQIQIDQVIHFAFDKAVIKPVSYPILNDVASIIKNNESSISQIMVEGNTDSIGSDAYNQGLSDRRANAVRDYLIQQGVPASKLQSVGYGESRPVASNETAEGRAKNRRVEFKVE